MKTMMIVLAGVALLSTANAATINQRRLWQQDRIAQGIRSGSLTPGEAAYLEHREAGLNREIRWDRFKDGGSLSRADRFSIQRQQNRLSDQIWDLKHNRRVR